MILFLAKHGHFQTKNINLLNRAQIGRIPHLRTKKMLNTQNELKRINAWDDVK